MSFPSLTFEESLSSYPSGPMEELEGEVPRITELYVSLKEDSATRDSKIFQFQHLFEPRQTCTSDPASILSLRVTACELDKDDIGDFPVDDHLSLPHVENVNLHERFTKAVRLIDQEDQHEAFLARHVAPYRVREARFIIYASAKNVDSYWVKIIESLVSTREEFIITVSLKPPKSKAKVSQTSPGREWPPRRARKTASTNPSQGNPAPDTGNAAATEAAKAPASVYIINVYIKDYLADDHRERIVDAIRQAGITKTIPLKPVIYDLIGLTSKNEWGFKTHILSDDAILQLHGYAHGTRDFDEDLELVLAELELAELKRLTISIHQGSTWLLDEIWAIGE